MRKTDNAKLVKAMQILASDIESDDGVANAAICEAAQRIEELAAIALEMLAMLPHHTAMPGECRTCEIRGRLEEMGVVI